MWFCLVLVLAVGWGGHFRYSQWLEENLMRYRAPDATVEEMKTALDEERDQTWKWMQENARLNHALGTVLTREQLDEIEKLKAELQPDSVFWQAGGYSMP